MSNLTQIIQQQQKEIEELKKRVTALEEKVQSLKKGINYDEVIREINRRLQEEF